MSAIGTKNSNQAQTKQKCNILRKTHPELADFAESLFLGTSQFENRGLTSPAPQTENAPVNRNFQEEIKKLDSYSKNILLVTFSEEILIINQAGENQESFSDGPGTIAETTGFVVGQIKELKTNLNKALQPVSSWTGQTLGNLTDVLKDPLGAPFSVPMPLMGVIDKVSPEFADRLDASIKKLKLDELKNLPANAMGSLRSLASTIDETLKVPFEYAADLYNGLMKIMGQIADAIDAVMAGIMDLVFGPGGVLDSIFPINAILEFVNELSEIASFLGNITSSFGGLDFVNQGLSQLQNFSSQFQGILQNPQQLLQSYLPADIGQLSQVTSILRNPQQFLSQIIPPEISGQLSQIASIPGLGFVGNLGYGIEGVLQAGSKGIATTILSELDGQLGVLGPLFNKSSETLTDKNQDFPPTVEPSTYNPNIPVARTNNSIGGVPLSLNDPPPVLPTFPSSAGLKQNGIGTTSSRTNPFSNPFTFKL